MTDAAKLVAHDVAEAAKKSQKEIDAQIQKIERVYVAVHGIGEQFQFETVQQVANRLAKYFDSAMPIPLGTFHSAGVKQWGFLPLTNPPYPVITENVGLAEIYWADIPREVQKEGHTLEEAKKWAASLVGRIRMRERGGKGAPQADDYQMLEQVVGEMIEGIALLDRLLFLVGKMSTFKFQLKQLLDSFLGDVQVVTDFEIQRIKLLGQFHAAMEMIRKANPDADIYIVAHSEGTVVAFLGLLKAFKEYRPAAEQGEEEQLSGLLKTFKQYKPAAKEGDAERFGWIKQVKGLMTLGSPIEEHLILWPELWEPYRSEKDEDGKLNPVYKWTPEDSDGRIKWRNYYDHGDPIAYRMDATREWIRENQWDAVFEYEGPSEKNQDGHEFRFSRYLFPGKAHVDYWGDAQVFGHFIKMVVKGGDPGRNDAKAHGPSTDQFLKPPQSLTHVKVFSRVVPYLIPAALLLIGVYIMFKAVSVRNGTHMEVFRDVAGISLLLLGITVASRVPRLTRSWWAWIVAYGIFFATLLVYPLIVSPEAINFLGGLAARPFSWTGWEGFGPPLGDYYTKPAIGLMIVAAVLVLIVMKISATFPRLGAKTLIVPGCIIILGIVLYGIYDPSGLPRERGAFLPILLAEAAFLYLWWLAVVLFDLIYVWHHYVRGSYRGATMTDRLRVVCKDPASEG